MQEPAKQFSEINVEPSTSPNRLGFFFQSVAEPTGAAVNFYPEWSCHIGLEALSNTIMILTDNPHRTLHVHLPRNVQKERLVYETSRVLNLTLASSSLHNVRIELRGISYDSVRHNPLLSIAMEIVFFGGSRGVVRSYDEDGTEPCGSSSLGFSPSIRV
jgi:hypothetical protein